MSTKITATPAATKVVTLEVKAVFIVIQSVYPMKSNTSLIYNFWLVVGDFLALVAAFVGGYGLRSASSVPVAHPPRHIRISKFS